MMQMFQKDSSDLMRTRCQGQGGHDPHAAQYEETGRNRLTTRALYDTEEEEEEEEEVVGRELLQQRDPSLALSSINLIISKI